MKKVMLSLVAAASFAVANAQSGTILVGGNVGVSADKTANDVKTTSFSVNPTVGYQFNDNWTLGVTGGVSGAKLDPSGPNQTAKATTYNAGPFVRYTAPVSDIFAIFGQLQGGYQAGSLKTETTVGNSTITSTDKTKGAYAKLFPAVFINVKNNFGLNFDFGGVEYNSLKADGADKAHNTFDFTFGKTVNIGISKNF